MLPIEDGTTTGSLQMMFELLRVITASRVCPFMCVGVVMCCFRSCASNRDINLAVYASLMLSRCRFTSPTMSNSVAEILTRSTKSKNSSMNLGVVSFLSSPLDDLSLLDDGGGRYTIHAVHCLC